MIASWLVEAIGETCMHPMLGEPSHASPISVYQPEHEGAKETKSAKETRPFALFAAG
jgi:hypothetical protein